MARLRDSEGKFLPAPGSRGKKHKNDKYNKRVALRLCNEISTGRSLSNVCKDPDSKEWGCPVINTVKRWYRDYEDFRIVYDMAQEDRADVFVDRLDELMSKVESGDLDEKKAKFISDQIRWISSKLNTTRWGIKADHKDTDTPATMTFNFQLAQGEQPKQIEAEVHDVKKVIDVQDVPDGDQE